MRRQYESRRAKRLRAVGREADWLEGLERAWRADPGQVDTAYKFAYWAWKKNTRLEAGLAAIETAIASHDRERHTFFQSIPDQPGYWPWHESYPRWVESQHADRVDYHAVRDQLEWAISPTYQDWTRPEQPVMDAAHHLEKGLESQDREARRHLVQAALSEGPEATLAKAELQTRNPWFVAGLDVHLEAWTNGPVHGEWLQRRFYSGRRDDLTGPFPMVEFEVGSDTKTLDDYDGLRVVDVWASWCGPCLPGLRKLNEMTSEYPDVTFIAVSVDSNRRAAENAVEGLELGLVMGWAPKTFAEVTNSYPTAIVVDASGQIVETLHGNQISKRLPGVLDAAQSR